MIYGCMNETQMPGGAMQSAMNVGTSTNANIME